MRKLSMALLGAFALLLDGCSGSDTYSGSWKALDSNGEKFEMFFEAKSFTVKSSDGKRKKFNYTQNSVKTENFVETYGILLEDGRGYQIHFPIADDESIGLIGDENGNPLYTIGRNDYVKYEDIVKLQ